MTEAWYEDSDNSREFMESVCTSVYWSDSVGLTRDNQVELFCLSKPTRKVTYSASLTFGSVAESVLLHLANLLLNLNRLVCI